MRTCQPDRFEPQHARSCSLLLQILGRAENVAGFIRRGTNEGWTEITLSGGPGKPDVVIVRTMKLADKERQDGTKYIGVESSWTLNSELLLESFPYTGRCL